MRLNHRTPRIASTLDRTFEPLQNSTTSRGKRSFACSKVGLDNAGPIRASNLAMPVRSTARRTPSAASTTSVPIPSPTRAPRTFTSFACTTWLGIIGRACAGVRTFMRQLQSGGSESLGRGTTMASRITQDRVNRTPAPRDLARVLAPADILHSQPPIDLCSK